MYGNNGLPQKGETLRFGRVVGRPGGRRKNLKISGKTERFGRSDYLRVVDYEYSQGLIEAKVDHGIPYLGAQIFDKASLIIV